MLISPSRSFYSYTLTAFHGCTLDAPSSVTRGHATNVCSERGSLPLFPCHYFWPAHLNFLSGQTVGPPPPPLAPGTRTGANPRDNLSPLNYIVYIIWPISWQIALLDWIHKNHPRERAWEADIVSTTAAFHLSTHVGWRLGQRCRGYGNIEIALCKCLESYGPKHLTL